MTVRATENSQFQLVGETYCDGFMTGEALLGPLPDRFGMIFCAEEKSRRHVPRFIDRETRTIQVEDPRLGPLPQGWHREDRNGTASRMRFESDYDRGKRT